jgi:hypothetical protein
MSTNQRKGDWAWIATIAIFLVILAIVFLD